MFRIGSCLVAVATLLCLACTSDPNYPTGSLTGSPLTSGLGIGPGTIPLFPTDPGDFIAGIENPYLAFAPGRVFRYEGETDEGRETIVVEVLSEPRSILGIAATVVHDRAYLDGELVENTFDWYAEDADGNVWYLGEYSEEIEDGEVVSTEGSWEAGVDGAEPGIIMLAQPFIGAAYRQEYAEGVAEDMARVLARCDPVDVPAGAFDCALRTMEWTPLEPAAREFKYYVQGTGLVLETTPRGGRVRLELVSVEDQE